MAERQYPSNSDASRTGPVTTAPTNQAPPTNPKNISPAVSGAQPIQKNALDKASEFLGFNKPRTFGDWVQTIADMTNRVYSAFDTITGNRRGTPTVQSQPTVPATRVAYGQFYQSQQQSVQYAQPKNTSSYTFDDILYKTRGDAEVVLAQMYGLLSEYGNVSVGDFYDLSGITAPNGYTDNKYGWKDLSMARVVPVGANGYMIMLPVVVQLK